LMPRRIAAAMPSRCLRMVLLALTILLVYWTV